MVIFTILIQPIIKYGKVFLFPSVYLSLFLHIFKLFPV